MNFDVLFGVKPERELEKLRRIRDNGENYALVLGDKPVGKNNWVITGLAEAVKAFDGWGDMIKATVTVTMTEYVKNKGVTSWSELKYSGVLVSASTTNGNITIDGTDIAVYTLPIASASVVGGVKSQTPGTGKVVVAGDGTMSVGQVEKANQLATARTISVAGDATGSGSFNGTTDMTMKVLRETWRLSINKIQVATTVEEVDAVTYERYVEEG